MGLTLDAAPLVAAERGDETFDALVEGVLARGRRLAVAATTVAEVFRGTREQARLFRALRGVDIIAIDAELARRAGHLLRAAGSSNTLDAIAVAVAAARGDAIVTSDIRDVRPLAVAAGVTLKGW